jgi:hypothetical protein
MITHAKHVFAIMAKRITGEIYSISQVSWSCTKDWDEV